MPVIRPRPPQWNARRSRQSLVEQLVKELRGEVTDGVRPVIFEVPINQGESLHVIVAWNEWEGVPPEDRSASIMEAYELYDAEGVSSAPISPRITLAIGATAPEASKLNLLPYRILLHYIKGDVSEDAIREALLEEGAIEIGSSLPRLAFPTLAMAEESLRRLQERLPEVNWRIPEDQ